MITNPGFSGANFNGITTHKERNHYSPQRGIMVNRNPVVMQERLLPGPGKQSILGAQIVPPVYYTGYVFNQAPGGKPAIAPQVGVNIIVPPPTFYGGPLNEG